MWRKILFFPPVIIAVALVYWAVSSRQPPTTGDPVEEFRTVRTIVATPVDIVPRVTGFGTVQPAKTWKAVVQVGGEITYIHPDLKRGVVMQAGTEIIRISPSDYQLAIARAKANIARVDAQLAELEASQDNIRANLEIEKQALSIKERELGRRTKLAEAGTVAATVIDQDTRETLSQRKKVQELQNTLALLPSQRRALDAQKDLNELELDQANLNLGRTRITLPFDARIAEVNAEISQFAQTGATLVSADGIEVSEVEAQIPMVQFGRLARAAMRGGDQTGDVSMADIRQVLEGAHFQATIKLAMDPFSVEWPAEFSRLSETIDLKTRSLGVIVTASDSWKTAIMGERPPLAKGLFVTVDLRLSPIKDRIIIPRSVIHSEKIYIADGNDRLRIVPISTSFLQGEIAVIAEGLKPGDRIVVSDLLPAIEGMLLNLIRDTALESQLVEEANGDLSGAQL